MDLPLQRNDFKDFNDLWYRYDRERCGELSIKDIYFLAIEMRFLIEFKLINKGKRDPDLLQKQNEKMKRVTKELSRFINKTSAHEKEHRGYIYNHKNGNKIQIKKLITYFKDTNIKTYKKG